MKKTRIIACTLATLLSMVAIGFYFWDMYAWKSESVYYGCINPQGKVLFALDGYDSIFLKPGEDGSYKRWSAVYQVEKIECSAEEELPWEPVKLVLIKEEPFSFFTMVLLPAVLIGALLFWFFYFLIFKW